MSYQDDIARLDSLTRADIDDMLTRAALDKARDYQRQHRVIEREVSGNTIYAQVRGSALEPYDVEISVEEGDIYAGCTCPYELSGWCKHIGAVLLEWIENRNSFKVVDEPKDSLFEQDRDDEIDLLGDDTNLLAGDDLYVKELESLLDHFKIDELREIARQRHVNLTVTRKEEIVEMLAAQLANRELVQIQVAQIDELSRRILTFMHLAAPVGYGTPLAYIQPFGVQGQSNEAIRQRVDAMVKQGLLMAFSQKKLAYHVVPQIVRLCLPPVPNAMAPWPKDQAAHLNIKRYDFAMLSQKLYRMWTYLRERHPRRALLPPADPIESQWEHLAGWRHDPNEIAQVRKTGQYFFIQNQTLSVPPAAFHLAEADHQALCRLLNATVEEVEFYYALLAQMGAIYGQPGEAIQTERSLIQNLLSMPLDLQLAFVTSAWQATLDWNEMDGILRSVEDIGVRRNATYTTYKQQNLYEEWREGRQTVLRFLSLLQENTWVSVEAFQRTIHEIMPNLVHFMSNSGVWWLESTRKKRQFGAGFEDWLISYGRLVIAALIGPLAWLGAIELGYQEGRLVAIRLTPAGAFILGRRQTAFAPARPIDIKQAIRFNADLTADVMPGVAPIELYDLLGNIARLENATPQHLSYRLDASGIHRRFEQGDTAQSLLDRLAQLCPVPIPEPWQRRLRAWEANYGQLHLYQDIALIELADEFALQELLACTSLRERIIYQFSNRLLAISPAEIDGLVQEMEKRGYMPRVVTDS